MTIKTFERPIIELSHSLVFEKAKLIDKEYKLSIDDLSSEDKLAFVSQFLKISNSFDAYIQEYLNDACLDRMYADNQQLGGWE